MVEKNPNVYDNLKEAQFRLLRTIVMYDDTPYEVIAITNQREDKIFRVYLSPINWDGKTPRIQQPDIYHIPQEHPEVGNMLDKWLETDDGKKSGVLRKRMDSKFFNSFRPFPLGMCNHGRRTYYIEWSPLRSQHQGLTVNAIIEEPVTLMSTVGMSKSNVPVVSESFYECIKGAHPSAQECLEGLNDPTTQNDAHAFHRRFAFVKGPVDMLFLAYKSDIIGVLPGPHLSTVRIGRNFAYCKEVVAELGLFGNITI